MSFVTIPRLDTILVGLKGDFDQNRLGEILSCSLQSAAKQTIYNQNRLTEYGLRFIKNLKMEGRMGIDVVESSPP
jgi:hypothetical protein